MASILVGLTMTIQIGSCHVSRPCSACGQVRWFALDEQSDADLVCLDCLDTIEITADGYAAMLLVGIVELHR
jgi:hypothetical protein